MQGAPQWPGAQGCAQAQKPTYCTMAHAPDPMQSPMPKTYSRTPHATAQLHTACQRVRG